VAAVTSVCAALSAVGAAYGSFAASGGEATAPIFAGLGVNVFGAALVASAALLFGA
jgi:hypothetical protein